LRSPSLR